MKSNVFKISFCKDDFIKITVDNKNIVKVAKIKIDIYFVFCL
jgi:hypothetical protein